MYDGAWTTTPTTGTVSSEKRNGASSIPRKRDFAFIHINGRRPVTWSTIVFGPGPIPTQVTVPGGSSVKPASSARAVGKRIDRAFAWSARRSGREPPFTTTFFWPSAIHSANHFRWRAFASRAAITAAWATWTASLPRDKSRAERTAITSL